MSLEASQQGAGLLVQRVAAVGVLLPATGDRPGIAGTDGGRPRIFRIAAIGLDYAASC